MSGFSDHQKSLLSDKLDSAHIKSREQAGRKLYYIEGWHAIAEANRIFGFDAWTRETLDIRVVSERERKVGKAQKDGWSVSYVARVRVTVGGVVRDGLGAGHGVDVDLGLAHESAIKEAETDAMKRALMTFGNPFGLALYDKTQANVASEPTAFDLARQKIAAFAVQADLGLWWREHKEGLKATMETNEEYADLIALVRQRGEELAPKSEKEAA